MTRDPARRMVLFVASAAVVLTVATAGCGSSVDDAEGTAGTTAGPATSIDPAEATSWVAGHLPDSYRPVLLTEDAGRRTTYYAPEGMEGDVYDAPLRVVVTVEDELRSTAHADAATVDVNGQDATLAQLSDEGRPSGFAVSWRPAPGRWVTVEGLSDLSSDDVVTVARDVQPVDATEWDRLRRALSIDTRVGKVAPDADPVEVLSGSIDGEPYTLTALVPAGYPLGPEDQRIDCYRLAFRGESSGDRCDTHPLWMRVGGHLFVFGPADPGTPEVTIAPYRNGPGPTLTAATSSIAEGPPTAFYAVPLDDGTCIVELTPASDPNLGPIGPRPPDPEYPACAARLDTG